MQTVTDNAHPFKLCPVDTLRVDGLIALFLSDTKLLNALDSIPKLIEQYQAENAKLEKDLPMLREIVGGA